MRQRELVATGLGVAAILLAIALYSFEPLTDANLAGAVGAALADVLIQALGLSAFLLPIALVAIAAGVFVGRISSWTTPRTAAALGALLALATLTQLAFGEWTPKLDGLLRNAVNAQKRAGG